MAIHGDLLLETWMDPGNPGMESRSDLSVAINTEKDRKRPKRHKKKSKRYRKRPKRYRKGYMHILNTGTSGRETI